MLPRVPPMSGQVCVALCVADGAGDGVAALLAGPALTAVVLPRISGPPSGQR